MPEGPTASPTPAFIASDALDALFAALRARGHRIIGPTLRDQAIVYEELESPAELPAGWTDEQDGGRYRLSRRDDGALFGYAVGPQSWKRFLHVPVQRLWRSEHDGDPDKGGGVRIVAEPPAAERLAFIGVRACELKAIAIQDRVLMGGEHVDPHYKARREGAFLVAINCTQAGGTCFCVSMDSGPQVRDGFDLALTELLEGQGENATHGFVAEAGSEAGRAVLAELPQRPATAEEVAAAGARVEAAAQSMGRAMPDTDLRALLMDNPEHPRWAQVAERCLTCGNCTLVCPTCFCTSVEESSDLAGRETARSRRWDSCFTMDFSYIHGGSVRASSRSRYRQWMTHKLATWHDQFDSSGCVGCGRCITWCPVGIDITEEARAIQGESD